MERILSTEERIRRAEEIYQKRKYNNGIRISANNEQKEKNKIGLFKRMTIQIIICFIIYIIFYIVQNSGYIFSEDLINQTQNILEKDIDFEMIYKTVSGYIENLNIKNIITNQNKEESNDENTIIEETSSTIQEEVTLSITENEEENKNISQMELDANDIKEKFKFIKPIEGTISSRFGQRNPTTATVPTYHTGIDLAASTGTIIKAAIGGTVEICSSQGDYGNHLKIVNGDVATVYAHCKTLYVKKGDTVNQGDNIAEVGSTGNATGPHLHFEIRKAERYVNPEYVLSF